MIDDLLDPSFDNCIMDFEQTWTTSSHLEFERHLPSPDDPNYMQLAVELMRVDMELSWAAGERTTLADYEELLPSLHDYPELRAAVAYEEYRQRATQGEPVSIHEFANERGVDATAWSTFVAAADATATEATFDVSQLPAPGDRYREFEIIAEIGRGRLSRVFLARQVSLASREVVLKFAPRHVVEAEKLAKLQHTHIVPVFSVYTDEKFSVFCMPYLGTTTWADYRPQIRSEADLLTLSLKIAEAIEHAHRRGILHNDIKPANILVDERGTPYLLDFNLASDPMSTEGWRNIGGTLPFMPPEAIRALTEGHPQVDERSDLYALGAVLYEAIVGRRPFVETTDLQQAMRDRDSLNWPPGTAPTPGLQSIVSKCLACEPNDRYQSATQLVEDLRHQLQDEPLRYARNTSLPERFSKWCRRHPRLSSSTTLFLVVFIVGFLSLLAWNARGRQMAKLAATNAFTQFMSDAQQLTTQLSALELELSEGEEVLRQGESLVHGYLDHRPWHDSFPHQQLGDVERAAAKATLRQLAFLLREGHHWLAARSPEKATHQSAANAWHTPVSSQRLAHLCRGACARDSASAQHGSRSRALRGRGRASRRGDERSRVDRRFRRSDGRSRSVAR